MGIDLGLEGPQIGLLGKDIFGTGFNFDLEIKLGAGAFVCGEDTCMVDIAKFFLEFTVDESCGKCTPCQVGNKRLLTYKIDPAKFMERLKTRENLPIITSCCPGGCVNGGGQPSQPADVLRPQMQPEISEIILSIR